MAVSRMKDETRLISQWLGSVLKAEFQTDAGKVNFFFGIALALLIFVEFACSKVEQVLYYLHCLMTKASWQLRSGPAEWHFVGLIIYFVFCVLVVYRSSSKNKPKCGAEQKRSSSRSDDSGLEFPGLFRFLRNSMAPPRSRRVNARSPSSLRGKRQIAPTL